jgi:hypothetical protein
MIADWDAAAWPEGDDDELRRRQIEEMMRTDRPRYFRDEAVQQEYREILERQEKSVKEQPEINDALTSRPFDEALARFSIRKTPPPNALDDRDEEFPLKEVGDRGVHDFGIGDGQSAFTLARAGTKFLRSIPPKPTSPLPPTKGSPSNSPTKLPSQETPNAAAAGKVVIQGATAAGLAKRNDAPEQDVEKKKERSVIDLPTDRDSYFSQYRKFISDALEDKGEGYTRFFLGKTKNLIPDVPADKQKDWKHTIDSYAIRHFMKSHGDADEQLRGQIPITAEDIEKIPEVLESPDTIEPGNKTYGHRLNTVVYGKRFNGIVIYVEEIRTGKRQYAAASMWKLKR